MDYTIIGAEVNLAARLESVAEPGSIVMSYETYALVREIVAAHALAPLVVKGIPREIVPYVLDGALEESGAPRRIFSEHGSGIDLYLDVDSLDAEEQARARAILLEAAEALEPPRDRPR
uniref:Putative transmembrane adenylate cyclase n=1 Tax=mine drainage metagenome TaxID=410659 RepID=E6PE43_9ZZZZ